MPETKQPEMPTAHEQLIDFIRLCNAVMSKEGVLGKRTETKEGDMMFNESTEVQDAEKRLRGIDSELVQAIKFIYGRPNISHIDIPDLNLDKEEDAMIVMKLIKILKEDKLHEAIGLVEEAMADEEGSPKVTSVAGAGIEKAKKALEDFKPIREAYLARSEEAGKVKSIEDLNSKRVRLVESRKARMEEVARYDRQIAKLDANIKKLTGETKEKLAEVIPFPEKPAEAEVIPISVEKEQLAEDIASTEGAEEVVQELKREGTGGATIYEFPTKESDELPDQPA